MSSKYIKKSSCVEYCLYIFILSGYLLYFPLFLCDFSLPICVRIGNY